MMHLNGLFGHMSAWLLLGAAWLSLGAVWALALGVIAKVGKGRGEK